jgi:hypothetical protein
MGIERKTGTLKAVEEGKAVVRLATLFRVDLDNDVIEENFFPPKPGLKVSIQPYHNHLHPSLGHATVWQDTAKGEILSTFEFNDSTAAQEQYRVLKWDYEHGPISEFSWAFRVKPGASRSGTFEGKHVRFLGPSPDGSHGVDLIEAGPVLRGASINNGLLAVRSQGSRDGNIGPSHPDYEWIERMAKKAELLVKIEHLKVQIASQEIHERWLKRERELHVR